MSDATSADRVAVLRRTCEAYGRLARSDGGLGWPKLDVVAVRTDCTGGLDPAEAWQRTLVLRATDDVQGWVRHRSMAYRIGDDSASESSALGKSDEAGPPIAGEWLVPDDTARPDVGVSIHLRPDAIVAGCLAEWRYEERPLKEQDTLHGDEIPALRQRVAVMAHPRRDVQQVPHAQRVLFYHVFWGTADGEDSHALRRLFARFAGFDDACSDFEGEKIVIRPRKAKRGGE